ncbi:DUF3311 domain-containing protein [Geodermatophilus nigrescens]|uniref:Uncharacterized protein n=1 Tax=Geodermatophilus nigrescens TaxID=1070870 RepID=A0A1M5G255_9ACTN|nr:DUF3311 domain-containing protein [Geodermatophilus nigrescens]SHF97531.1 Protein of unknown function [Geodermatophilus nigrescens]
MASAVTPPAGGPRGTDGAPVRSDRSPWNWLLLVPIVVPLLVPLFNRVEPTLFGWPFFYWVQLLFVALGVLTTVVVYRATRRSPAEQAAARAAVARDTTPRDTAARDTTARGTTPRDTDRDGGR